MRSLSTYKATKAKELAENIREVFDTSVITELHIIAEGYNGRMYDNFYDYSHLMQIKK